MTPTITLLGVPTSAGAHHAGQDLAPKALREHGLPDRLRAAGFEVSDRGDVAGEVFQPDALEAGARNVDAVVQVAGAVADAVAEEARGGRLPIVMGGDCTITIGVVVGLQRVVDDVRLAYLDGDADLNSPTDTGSGILDASGIAHLLGVADTPLARLGDRVPILADDQLVLLGYDPGDPDSVSPEALARRPRLRHHDFSALRADPAGVTTRAVTSLVVPGSTLVAHFDVDAVDSRDLPLADFPHYGTGVTLDAATEVLGIVLGAPAVGALVLTEVNPTHDPGGAQLERYVDAVVQAVSTGLGRA